MESVTEETVKCYIFEFKTRKYLSRLFHLRQKFDMQYELNINITVTA